MTPLPAVAAVRACNEDDCTEAGLACYLPSEDEANGYYCARHCFQNGFCPACCEFWGGVEAFEFSPSHLCPNCTSELSDDDTEDSDDWGDDLL